MRVWILGAGFSASLGGPMLSELLSESALSILRLRHPETWLGDPKCELVVRAFSSGRDAQYWPHAEAFLAALSSYDEVHEGRIEALYQNARRDVGGGHEEDDPAESSKFDLAIMGAWATATVAAQCLDFVDRFATEGEAWLPYDRWAKSLDAGDVIITFNYDLVVERAFRRNQIPLYVPNPRMPETVRFPSSTTLLLKLHGSVEFRDTMLTPPQPHSLANLMANPAYIAMPGKSKASMTEYDFDELWDVAEQAMLQADQVSIVGYGCPASDEKSKAWLLDSLAA